MSGVQGSGSSGSGVPASVGLGSGGLGFGAPASGGPASGRLDSGALDSSARDSSPGPEGGRLPEESRPPEDAPRPVLIGVDGRSGSGKTTLAAALVARLTPFADVRLLALEDMYPGWDGLSAVTHDDGPYVRALRRLALGSPTEIPTWDWHGARPGPVRTLGPAEVVVCEGVGALSRAARGLLTLGVWVEADDRARRERALARDGETYAPHWDRWAEQEERYLAAHAPAAAADLRLRLH